MNQKDIDRIANNLLHLSKSNKYTLSSEVVEQLLEAVDLIDALAAKVTALDEDGIEPADGWDA